MYHFKSDGAYVKRLFRVAKYIVTGALMNFVTSEFWCLISLLSYMNFSLEKPFHFDDIYVRKKSTIFHDGYEHEFLMSYIVCTYSRYQHRIFCYNL